MPGLLLDEMFSGLTAEQLRAKGHDALAVVTDPALLGLSDDQILAHAADTGRALVTANIKDFPQDRAFTAAITSALSALLGQPGQIQPGQILFLQHPRGDG
jgi:hypothetical protein